MFLWVEAYRTAIYIQNRCPHTALGRKTPEEVFTSIRPDVSHLRYLAVSAIVTFMLTLGSWTLLERRGYLLVTTRLRRHTEYIFLLARGSV